MVNSLSKLVCNDTRIKSCLQLLFCLRAVRLRKLTTYETCDVIARRHYAAMASEQTQMLGNIFGQVRCGNRS